MVVSMRPTGNRISSRSWDKAEIQTGLRMSELNGKVSVNTGGGGSNSQFNNWRMI
jgi:hypothetical protein